MKKNKVIGLGLALMLGLSLIGCQENNKSNGNSGGSQKKQESSEKTEKKENSKNSGKVTVDTSWYENDGNAISSGIFVVGESLKAGDYTFTANDIYDGGNATVAVFENLDKYLNFYCSVHSNYEEYDSGLGIYSEYNTKLTNGESCGVNVSDENVLLIDGLRGSLASESNENASDLTSEGKVYSKGLYSSKQLSKGTYIVLPVGDTTPNIITFESKDKYSNYNYLVTEDDSEKTEDIGTYGMFDSLLNNGNTCMIDVTNDNIQVLIEDGSCYIQKVKMNWSIDETK